MVILFAVCVFVCSVLPSAILASKFQDEREYYTALMSLYTVDNTSMMNFIASVNSTEPRVVYVQAGLLALQNMDAVSGTIEIMISLAMSWTDDIVVASGYSVTDLFSYTNGTNDFKVDSLLVPHNTIWTPELVLINAVETLKVVGGEAYRPRYYIKDGTVRWEPMVKVRSSCSANVKYYPFDRQTCSLQFIPWGRMSTEITFKIRGSSWQTTYLEEDNDQWEIVETSTATSVRSGTPMLGLSVTIRRRPLYFAFNFILPILILVMLNGMVFWLPVKSGERIGFSVTCFLSFVVFLNTVMNLLPRTSSPMSYLCYYSVCMMVFSGTLTGVAILQMRLYYKPEEETVPGCVQVFIRCLRCQCRNGNQEEMKWPEVMHFLDILFFRLFVGGQIAFTLFFVAPIGANA